MATPILMYHRIGKIRRNSIVAGQYVGARQFRRQLRLLSLLGYRTINLDEMMAGFPAKSVVVTFDDGYQSFYDLALPELMQSGHTATVFLVSNLIGKQNDWDLAKGDVAEQLMDSKAIAESAKQGIDFGSHSANHADLVTCNSAQLLKEIDDSRGQLASILGDKPRWFCYPYGSQNAQVREVVQQAGYVGACATGKGGNGPRTDRFALRRVNIRSDTFLPYFWLKLRQAERREVVDL